jgi:SAM-dependent methyltransferase
VALDYSRAVDAASANLRRFADANFVQGDLLNPPFRRGALDFAYSIGVLQHTPDPRAALLSILSLLAPGGSFAMTIYARRWYTCLNAKYLVRPLTRRLPPALLLTLVRAAMPLAFPVTDILFRLPHLGTLARFLIPVANYVEKTEFNRAQRYEEAELDTFDMLAPAYDSPMTRDEVRDLLDAVGVEDYRFLQSAPVNVIGSMPGSGASPHPTQTAAVAAVVPGGRP